MRTLWCQKGRATDMKKMWRRKGVGGRSHDEDGQVRVMMREETDRRQDGAGGLNRVQQRRVEWSVLTAALRRASGEYKGKVGKKKNGNNYTR